MKFIIVFAALFAVALAAPPSNSGDAQILRSESDVGPESFSFDWETSDGQKAQAEGHLNDIGSDHEEIAVKGSYSFVGDDGQTYTVDYVADKNGFQPSGAHLPVAPVA